MFVISPNLNLIPRIPRILPTIFLKVRFLHFKGSPAYTLISHYLFSRCFVCYHHPRNLYCVEQNTYL